MSQPEDEQPKAGNPESTPPEETPAAAEAQETAKPAEQTSSAPAPGTGLSEDHVREALKEVIDPELFVNIVDLGLIYTVDLQPSENEGKFNVTIEMTMTSPMCPAGPQLVGNSKQVVSDLEPVDEVDVKVVMDPPWTQDMMSEDAKDQLNIF